MSKITLGIAYVDIKNQPYSPITNYIKQELEAIGANTEFNQFNKYAVTIEVERIELLI